MTYTVSSGALNSTPTRTIVDRLCKKTLLVKTSRQRCHSAAAVRHWGTGPQIVARPPNSPGLPFVAVPLTHCMWLIDSHKTISKFNRCHQMSDFKAKMHKIRFPLGLRPRLRWGSLQCSPRPSSCIYWGLILREGRKNRGKEKGEGKGREEEVGREGGKGRERMRPAPSPKFFGVEPAA